MDSFTFGRIFSTLVDKMGPAAGVLFLVVAGGGFGVFRWLRAMEAGRADRAETERRKEEAERGYRQEKLRVEREYRDAVLTLLRESNQRTLGEMSRLAATFDAHREDEQKFNAKAIEAMNGIQTACEAGFTTGQQERKEIAENNTRILLQVSALKEWLDGRSSAGGQVNA